MSEQSHFQVRIVSELERQENKLLLISLVNFLKFSILTLSLALLSRWMLLHLSTPRQGMMKL